MKKRYIHPAMHVTRTSPVQMIATSIKVGGTVNKEEDINFVKEDASADDEGFWDEETDW